jgi:hypothetical protein
MQKAPGTGIRDANIYGSSPSNRQGHRCVAIVHDNSRNPLMSSLEQIHAKDEDQQGCCPPLQDHRHR